MKTKSSSSFIEKSPTVFAALLVFVGALFFSTKAVLIKLAYQYDIDSLSLLTLRMVFSLPLFLLTAFFFRKKNNKLYTAPISTRDWISIIGLGITGFFIASLLDFVGLQYVSAGMERLILFTYPTIVLLLNVVLFKEKINKTQILALLITYFGIAVAFFEGVTLSGYPHFLYGGLLIFCCAFAYASYLVGSGRILPRIGAIRFTAYAMTGASAAVIIQHGILQQWQLFHFAAEVYYLAILMAIFATVLPSFMISEGIRIIGASNAAIIGGVGPISTIILAYFFLDENLGLIQWVGTAFVILGVVLISIRKRG